MELELSFPRRIEFDGFALILSNRLQCSSMSFQLLGMGDDSPAWVTHGSSAFRSTMWGIRFLQGYIPCRRVIGCDYRHAWPLFCQGPLQFALQAFLGLVFCACGALCRPRLGARSLGVILACLAVDTVAAGLGFVALGRARESIEPLFQAAGYLAMATALALAQACFVDVFTVWSCILILVRIVTDCAGHGDCQNLVADFPFLPSLGAVVGASFLALRLAYVRRALDAARADEAALDAAWREGFSTVIRSAAGLNRLRELVRALQAARAADPQPRQCNRRRIDGPDGEAAGGGGGGKVSFGLKRASSASSAASRAYHDGSLLHLHVGLGDLRATAPCEPDPARPVSSLSRLYAQAFALSALLRERCRAWAALSGGRVDPTLDGTGGDLEGTEDERPGGEVKDPRRAAEKAMVRYDGDVSRLLDVCRSPARESVSESLPDPSPSRCLPVSEYL